MTQEHKDLLLKDLCARLPYGVKCAEVYPDGSKFENVWDIIKISKYVEDGIHISNCKTIYGYCSSIENIKPYLFPLSSMTDEDHTIYSKIWEDTGKTAYLEGCHHLISTIKAYKAANDYLLNKHYDINGLIPMGLANDATGKNIY